MFSICVIRARMEMISVPGKRSRPAPILLTDDYVKGNGSPFTKTSRSRNSRAECLFLCYPKDHDAYGVLLCPTENSNFSWIATTSSPDFNKNAKTCSYNGSGIHIFL